jgi:uncharacterized protein involved in exopolysaccharide biosynthesis
MYEGNRVAMAGPTSSPDSSLSLAQLVGGLFRQRWVFLLVASLIFGLALFWTFGTGKRYTSEMVLLVQNSRGNDVISSSQSGSAPPVGASDVSEEQLNSEIAILNSDDLLDQIVDPSWKNSSREHMSREQLEAHANAVRALRGQIRVAPVRSSHAISIKVVARSGSEARSTLNSLLDAFLQKQRQIGRPAGASALFAEEAEEYRKKLAAARLELANYQNQHGFVSLATREGELEGKVLDLQSQHRDVEVQIVDAEKRIAADTQELATLPERQPTIESTSPATGRLDQLSVLLLTLTNKRTELLTKYKPDDRLVKEVDQQLADTRASLREAAEVAPQSASTDVNPNWQAAQRDLMTGKVLLNGLLARRAKLAGQISTLSRQLSGTELQSGDFEGLAQKVAELENGYRAFVTKRDESLVSDLMDQHQWLNVAVAEYPTLSLSPSHPKPFTDLVLGAGAALLMAGCAVFLCEVTRQKIANPAELEAATRYPVLATVPFLPSQDRISAGASERPGFARSLRPGHGQHRREPAFEPNPASE